MTVYLVGAGPGDPGLLTRRAAALLVRADAVVYDRLVDPAVLSLARPGAELVDVGKRPGPGAPPGAESQRAINDLLVDMGHRVDVVVRLKGGDPFVFGRGGEEAEALSAAGVRWEVVPGVSSALAVPALAGIPVTHRGVATSFTVVTGQVGSRKSSEGSDPVPGGGREREEDWRRLAGLEGTLVVLMGVAARAELAAGLIEGGRRPDTPVTVIERGATPAQRVVRTTLAELPTVALDPPAVVVIGPAAAMDLTLGAPNAPNALAPLAGVTVVVTRPRHQAGSLADALSAAGARVLLVPATEIEGPSDGGKALAHAAAAAAGYDWVAFTSANAVERFVPLMRDGRDLAGVRLAVVGQGTQDALTRHRLVADLSPGLSAGPGAAGLVSCFPDPPPGGGTVLWPCAEGAGDALAAGLTARGWRVDQVAAYRTVAAAPPPVAVADALAGAQAVVFAAPSAVRAYVAMSGPDGEPVPVPPVVVCIGPTTASTARDLGLVVAAEPPTPSPDALLESLRTALAGVLAATPRPAAEPEPQPDSP